MNLTYNSTQIVKFPFHFQSLEDLVLHYDGTVRNAEGCVVQIAYGCDGLDPTYMEGINKYN